MENVIDAAHIQRQHEWIVATFGPGSHQGYQGILDHIRKELDEIEENPNDLEEWIDVMTLAISGALRAGHSEQSIIDALIAKQTKNEQRQWPDWRTADQSKAIEHVRE